jgi:hypothetical protein
MSCNRLTDCVLQENSKRILCAHSWQHTLTRTTHGTDWNWTVNDLQHHVRIALFFVKKHQKDTSSEKLLQLDKIFAMCGVAIIGKINVVMQQIIFFCVQSFISARVLFYPDQSTAIPPSISLSEHRKHKAWFSLFVFLIFLHYTVDCLLLKKWRF